MHKNGHPIENAGAGAGAVSVASALTSSNVASAPTDVLPVVNKARG